jgi:acyl-CoA reductase-like NAD-dependent aldehyde dehydrogenase
MLLRNEESFGPSAALFIARDDQHAVELANDSKYGLNAAIHTKDFNRAWMMTQELDFGQVHTNNMICSVAKWAKCG